MDLTHPKSFMIGFVPFLLSWCFLGAEGVYLHVVRRSLFFIMFFLIRKNIKMFLFA